MLFSKFVSEARDLPIKLWSGVMNEPDTDIKQREDDKFPKYSAILIACPSLRLL